MDNKELKLLNKQYNDIEDYYKDEIIENNIEINIRQKMILYSKGDVIKKTNATNKKETECQIYLILKQNKVISKILTFIISKQWYIFEV